MDSGDAVKTRVDTQDLDAYSAYLEANQRFRSRVDLDTSFSLFEQAIAKDSQFARAWAGLAAVAMVMPSWGFDDRDYYAISEAAAKEAIDLDDSLALPYAVLGLFTSTTMRDFEVSLAYFTESLERDPKEATTYLWRGIDFMQLGFFDESLADFRTCLDIDPRYELCRRHLSNNMLYMSDFDAAESMYLKGLEAGFIGGAPLLRSLLAARGERLAFSLIMAGENNAQRLNALTPFIVSAAFDPDYSFATERLAIEAAWEKATGSPLDWGERQHMAFYLHNFAALDEGMGIGEVWAPFPVAWSMSEHPKRMMRANGFPDYWRKHGFPPQCRPVGDDDFECEVGASSQQRRAGPVN